ncbi:hypothetical protein GUJ93_ZPchr0013g35757 [Zizania palustris]|uniref:Uncharacterized protein n=1 Tax=Zizania palustris TaxID=103762 RepID=A0A8J5X636_ZIZPA|nr:hypothetical protein GUJ93_ZPchr0013g35757 [Zizania palustris]
MELMFLGIKLIVLLEIWNQLTLKLVETMGHTDESAIGHGMMDEFVPEDDVGQEEPQGDSQDMASQSVVGGADSGSKICGSTKADYVGSGEKMSHAIGQESNLQHSLSCNDKVYYGIDLSKEEVTQTGKMRANDVQEMILLHDIRMTTPHLATSC